MKNNFIKEVFGKMRKSNLKGGKMMGNNENPFYNKSGCADPTAFYALKHIDKEEKELEKKVHDLIHVLKFIVECAGFEFIGRIQLKHKKSRKEFK